MALAFPSCVIASSFVTAAIVQTMFVLAVIAKVWLIAHAPTGWILYATPPMPTAIFWTVLWVRTNRIFAVGGGREDTEKIEVTR